MEREVKRVDAKWFENYFLFGQVLNTLPQKLRTQWRVLLLAVNLIFFTPRIPI